MTAQEVYDIFPYYTDQEPSDSDDKIAEAKASTSFRVSKGTHKIYAGKTLGLYAIEDCLDQVICKLARKLDLDILILTDMIGSHQIVTEILDTRSRQDSFKNLVYIVD